MAVNRLAYLLAGMVVGAAGMALARSEKGKELISCAVKSGGSVVENVLGRVEMIKEDIEDHIAERNYMKAQQKEAAKAEAGAKQAEQEAQADVPDVPEEQ